MAVSIETHEFCAWDASVEGNNDLTVAKPSGTVEGDLLIIIAGRREGTGLRDPEDAVWPSGWTQIDYAQTVPRAYLLAIRKLAGPSEPASYTINVLDEEFPRDGYIACLRVAGINAEYPVNVSANADGVGGTSPEAPSVETDLDGCLLVRAFVQRSTATITGFLSSGSTLDYHDLEIATQPSITGAINYSANIPAGVYGAEAWTLDATNLWAALTIAIAPGPIEAAVNVALGAGEASAVQTSVQAALSEGIETVIQASAGAVTHAATSMGLDTGDFATASSTIEAAVASAINAGIDTSGHHAIEAAFNGALGAGMGANAAARYTAHIDASAVLALSAMARQTAQARTEFAADLAAAITAVIQTDAPAFRTIVVPAGRRTLSIQSSNRGIDIRGS